MTRSFCDNALLTGEGRHLNSGLLGAAIWLGLCIIAARGDAIAQDIAAPAAPQALTAAAEPPESSLPCCALPDGTIVELEIAEPISSKTAKRGQRFKLTLSSPLYADGVMLLPAGTEGVGEVVHADRARAAGKPGELLLTGRSLAGPDGEIKLRGFRMGGSGENRVLAAFWIPLGFLIHGGQIEIPTGARAHAKLAGPHRIRPSTATTTAPAAASTATPSLAPPSPDPTQVSSPDENGTESPPPSP